MPDCTPLTETLKEKDWSEIVEGTLEIVTPTAKTDFVKAKLKIPTRRIMNSLPFTIKVYANTK